MPELIDRRKLLNTLCKECGHCKNMEEAEQGSAKPCSVHRIISEQPTIEAEPVRRGRWETWGYVFHGIEWKRCSCCGKCADVSYYGMLDGGIRMSTPAICGCCGTRMDGGDENA